VVLDRRDDGPLRPEVERLDLAVALELLAPQTSYLSDMPAPLHVVGDLLDLVGGAVRIRYREAAELDAVIDELLRAEPSTSKAPRAPRTPGEAAVPAEPGTYARTPVIDALDFGDGRLAVLRRSDTGSRVHVLDGIGPAIWEAASGRTLTELTAGVVAAHGQPDGVDPEVLVDAAVQALVADDLLTSAPAHT
jgi:hypothetical protein